MAKKNFIDQYNEEESRKRRFDIFFERGPIDELDTNIADPNFRYKISGVECVPSGEVIAIAGKPGVGKSTALAILIGVLIGNKTFGETSCVTPCKRVLWVDTEKGTYSCIKRIKTLNKVAGFNDGSKLHENGVDFYPMREVSVKDRLYFVEELAKKKEYDVFVIDGIFDLTTDPDKDYTPVIDLLKLLASNKNSVFAVLHTNKQAEDDNMRYALGTELQRICTTRFTIKKEKEHCHAIIHDKSNDTALAPKVLFKFDNSGDVSPLVSQQVGNAIKEFSRKVFEKILTGGVALSRKELIKKMQESDSIKEDAAIKRIKKAYNEYGIIDKNEDGKYFLKNAS